MRRGRYLADVANPSPSPSAGPGAGPGPDTRSVTLIERRWHLERQHEIHRSGGQRPQ